MKCLGPRLFQKIEKVVETFKANEQVVLNAENRKLIRQSGFKI